MTAELAKVKALARQRQSRRENEDDHNPLDVRAGVSTSGDIALLRLEAEMAAGGDYSVDNPHIPVNEATLDAAQEAIESDGHTPAWSQ